MQKSDMLFGHLIAIFCISLIFIFGCRKKTEVNPCSLIKQPTADFSILELVGDTSFIADTIFRDNVVTFKSSEPFESFNWKVGDDPRSFTNAEFNLTFFTSLVTIPITLTGKLRPNTVCFPNDQGTYVNTKQFTTVEQFDKSLLRLSPMIGRYRGYFTDSPSDTFTVNFQYFDSSKYDVMLTGRKNFYYLSNFPKGFTNTSTPGFLYPELARGVQPEMGYKSFVFDYSNTKGRGWLSKDTLHINYANYNSPLIRKKFIGIKL